MTRDELTERLRRAAAESARAARSSAEAERLYREIADVLEAEGAPDDDDAPVTAAERSAVRRLMRRRGVLA